MPMLMQPLFKFNPLLLSPFSKSKPSSSPLTIADILLLQDHEEDRLFLMDSSTGSSNASKPRPITARFFSAFNRGKSSAETILRHEDADVAPPDNVTGGPDLSSEICGRESNFNVGIGCCLIHLIDESKTELQKMMELRIEMESILQNVKEELLNKDLFVPKDLESKYVDEVEENTDLNINLTSNRVLFDQSSNCDDAPKEEDCLEGMDRLEAELEIELERLQLHLDSGKFSSNPPQETIEESTVNTTSAISYAEVIDPTIEVEEEDCPVTHCRVPPHELERKLHELLETRQEQRIRELEAALESARQELSEKEREISWWKDTAHLMLKHFKQPSSLNLQYVRYARHLR